MSPSLFPSLLLLLLSIHTHKHTHKHAHTNIAEAVVLLDYEKQQDDELTLEVGDVITDVKQVRTVSKPLLTTTVHGTTCRLQQEVFHECVINRNMERVAPCIVVVAGDVLSFNTLWLASPCV